MKRNIKVPQIKAVANKTPRNAFDLSQAHNFTAPVGGLVPLCPIHVRAGDHVSLNIQDFMRVMPCNSAAFVDCKGVYETFFVRYSQLWKMYDQFITSMADYKSALFANMYPSSSGALAPPIKIPSVTTTFLNSAFTTGFGTDIFGFPQNPNLNRMLDNLGYGPFYKSDGTTAFWTQGTNPFPITDVNLFPILAYQKIYSDVYRNSQYEPYDPLTFNIDDWVSGNNTPTQARLSKIFNFRYRNYGLDLLTNIRPSVLVDAYTGSSLYALVPDVGQHDWSTSGDPNPVNESGISVGNDNHDAPVSDVMANLGETATSISVRSLRASFAYQKLLDIMGRAPKTYKDQMKAVYGVDVQDGRDGRVSYLGGIDSPFQFGDVVNTAISASDTTASSPYSNGLGASVSKGTASGNGSMQFDVPEDGIILTIYSIIPRNFYDGTRIDPFVRKVSRTDFYIPQYDRLGMQPLYQSDVTSLSAIGTAPNAVNQSRTHALGWQPRYSEYKTAIDINHGQFINGEPLAYFTSNRCRNLFSAHNWLTGLSLRDLKINPNIFDSVFKVGWNGKPTTDPFYGTVQFNIIKVSNMDVDSMPNV